MKCAFCGAEMKVEVYKHYKPWKDKRFPSSITMEIYCDNPDCPVKPISAEGIPTVAIADAEAIGCIPEPPQEEGKKE